MLRQMLQAQVHRDRDRLKEVLIGAWHGAYYQRVKNFPSLEKALQVVSEPKPVVAKTPKELAAIAREWTVQLGGNVNEVRT